jgi:hypothetical protein
MKKKIFVMGMSALALIFILGLTGCASTMKEMVKDTPVDQRAVLYLYDDDSKITKVDGVWETLKGWEWFPPWRGSWAKGQGNYKINGKWTMKPTLEVTPNEHIITVNKKAFIGTKNYEITYKFESGKQYFVWVTTDPKLTIAEQAKKTLTGDYIVLIVPFTGKPIKDGAKIGDTIIPTSAEADKL